MRRRHFPLLALSLWLLSGPALGQDFVKILVHADPPDAEVYSQDGGTKLGRASVPFLFDRERLHVGSTKLDQVRILLRRPGYAPKTESIDSNALKGVAREATVDWPPNQGIIALSPLKRGSTQWLWGLSIVPILVGVGLRRRKPAPSEANSHVHDAGAAPWELQTGEKVGEYVVQERLGEGVSAVVYRVSGPSEGGASLALKLLKPADFRGVDVMARFRREMKALARLRHSNIPYLADFGEFRGMAYLVMELLSGQSLKSRLAQGPVDPDQALDIVGQMASALAFAHRRGVLHRDIKPDNVVLDEDGKVRLTDFGLARSHDSTTLTVEGSLLGTPAYMAPELVQGERAEASSDQYALGCLAFELLTGRPPFEGESPLAIAVQQISAPPPDLRELCPVASPAMVQLIARMMEKDKADRFDSLDSVVNRVTELRGAS